MDEDGDDEMDVGRTMDGIGKMLSGFAPVVERSGDSPWSLAGKIVGLGKAELSAGVPKWAWTTIGVTAGVTAMWLWGDTVKHWVRRAPRGT